MRLALLALIALAVLATAQTSDGSLTFGTTPAICPHAAWGGAWTSTIYIRPVTQSTFTLRFLARDATFQTVPFVSNLGVSGRGNIYTNTLPAGVVEAIEIPAVDEETSTGWITVAGSPGSRAQVYVVFRQSVPGRNPVESSISCSIPTASRVVREFVFDNRNGGETGVAVVDPILVLGIGTSIGFDLACFERATEIGRAATWSVGLTYYSVFTLSSRIPATAGKVGYCTLTSPPPQPGRPDTTYAPALAVLHFTPDGAFSTVPVMTR
jgi:hypothetical protein